jgi:hypothetical protein
MGHILPIYPEVLAPYLEPIRPVYPILSIYSRKYVAHTDARSNSKLDSITKGLSSNGNYGAPFGNDFVARDRDFTRDRAMLFANERDNLCPMKQ